VRDRMDGAVLKTRPEDEREAAEHDTEDKNATRHQRLTMTSPVSLSAGENARLGICQTC